MEPQLKCGVNPGRFPGMREMPPGQHRGQPQVGPLPGVALAELHFRPLRGAGHVEDGGKLVPVDVLLAPRLDSDSPVAGAQPSARPMTGLRSAWLSHPSTRPHWPTATPSNLRQAT